MAYQFILASASPRRREILTQAGIPFEIMPSDFEERTEYKTPEEYVKSIALGKAEVVAAKQAEKNQMKGIFLNAEEEQIKGMLPNAEKEQIKGMLPKAEKEQIKGMLPKAEEEQMEGVLPIERQWIILGADTIVAHRNEILTKPADRADAFCMLKQLQGDAHEVFTGIALIKKDKDGTIQRKNFAVKTQVVFYPMSDEEIEGYLDQGEYVDKAGAYAIQGKSAVYIREIHGDYYNVVGLPLSVVMMALKEWGITAGDLQG